MPTRSPTLLEDKGKVCSHSLMNRKPSYMTLQPERQKAPLISKVQMSVRPDHIEIVSLTVVLSLQVREGTKTNLESYGAAFLTLTTLESKRWALAVCPDLDLQTGSLLTAAV